MVEKTQASATTSYVSGMSSRDPVSEEKDRSDRKERKHKHRDRDREGKSKHRTTEAPIEELGGSHSRKDRDKVADFLTQTSGSRGTLLYKSSG